MKKALWITAALVLPLCLGCGGKTDSTTDNADSTATSVITGGNDSDGSSSIVTTDSAGTHAYRITVSQKPDSTAGAVAGADGRQQYDNAVEIQIERDGARFYAKTFHKEAFLDLLSADERKTCILQGLAYDYADDKGLHFGAQLGAPDSEDGPIFSVTVLPDGTVSIVKDFTQDTTGDEM